MLTPMSQTTEQVVQRFFAKLLLTIVQDVFFSGLAKYCTDKLSNDSIQFLSDLATVLISL